MSIRKKCNTDIKNLDLKERKKKNSNNMDSSYTICQSFESRSAQERTSVLVHGSDCLECQGQVCSLLLCVMEAFE